ncbi:Uncharacterised protein [uncultured archaeon]|nr:Uncharacterised protein [uncultured archaeon]
MKGGYLEGVILAGLVLLMVSGAQASMMSDIGITRVSEDCGKWKISFNWSEMDLYSRSVYHSDSTTGRVKVSTDTLTMTSSDKAEVVKFSVIAYSQRGATSTNSSRMMALANETLSKSNVCGKIDAIERQIDGRPGAFASGAKCPLGEPVYAAVFPVDYHLDRPQGVLASDGLGIVLSTYDQEIMDRLINSIKIEQKR